MSGCVCGASCLGSGDHVGNFLLTSRSVSLLLCSSRGETVACSISSRAVGYRPRPHPLSSELSSSTGMSLAVSSESCLCRCSSHALRSWTLECREDSFCEPSPGAGVSVHVCGGWVCHLKDPGDKQSNSLRGGGMVEANLSRTRVMAYRYSAWRTSNSVILWVSKYKQHQLSKLSPKGGWYYLIF